jgi:hypothetical protein
MYRYSEYLFVFAVSDMSPSPGPRNSVRCAGFTLHLMQVKAPTARKPQPPLNVTNESLGTSQKTLLCYCLAVLHTNLVCTTNLTPLWAQVWIKVFGTGTRTGFIVTLRTPQNEGTQFIRKATHCNFSSVFLPLESFPHKDDCTRKVNET